MNTQDLMGSYVAIATPMLANGQVDYVALEKLIEFHVENGTHGIVSVGTTGESATLNVDEHIAVVGFNNMEAGRIWKPALSSGDRNRDTLAYIIKQMLDSRLKDQTIKPRTQTIHMAFLPRASSE